MLNLLTANDKSGHHARSWYAATAYDFPQQPALKGEESCDVCVVGGGYTGLTTALALAERGYDVILLEAHRVGWGASGRNGGQVGTGQRLDQVALEKACGDDIARTFWDLSEEAKDTVTHLIVRHGIDCDYVPGILHADHRKRFVADSRRYVDHMRSRYGYDGIRFVDGAEMKARLASPAYYGGTLDMGAGHIHPLNFALGLARAAEQAGVRLFERSEVLRYEDSGGATAPVTVETAEGRVTAKHLVLACNGYLGHLDEQVAARVMPINNFIVATEPLGEVEAEKLIGGNVAVADSKFVVNYFRRSSDNRLLFGGGETYGYRFPDDIAAFVRRPMLDIFPQLKDVRIDYGWGGTLAITMKRMPYFGRVGANTLSASGFSGHGVALACLSGQVLAEAIDGTSSRFDVFASFPTPRFPGGRRLRFPLLVLAMTWYSLRDRLGI